MMAPAARPDDSSQPRGHRAMPGIGILAGFLPWIVFGLLSWVGQRPVGVACALVTSITQNALRARKHNLKSFELATLAFLAIEMSAWLTGGGPWFERWGTVVMNAVLAAMALGTIVANRPFTWQYARDDWPEPYWRDPLFLKTNSILTALWTVAFVFGATTAWIATRGAGNTLLLRYVLPNSASAIAAVVSLAFPAWYPRKELERRMRSRTPYDWPIWSGDGSSRDVVVVGAGLGALTAAALLARGGVRVALIDRNAVPGGTLRAVERKTHAGRFLLHPWPGAMAGLGPDGAVTNLLQRIGREDVLKVKPVSRAVQVDGKSVLLPAGSGPLGDALGEVFPAEAAGIRRLLETVEHMRAESLRERHLTGGVPSPSRTVEEEMHWPASHPHLFPWVDRSLEELFEEHVKDEKLRRLLRMMSGGQWQQRQSRRVGRAVVEFDTLLDGRGWLEGGAAGLAMVLAAEIIAHGGLVLYGRAASRIRVKSGRVSYVMRSDGERLASGLVLSGIGFGASQRLIRRDTRRFKAPGLSTGLRVVHAAIDSPCQRDATLTYIPEDPIGPMAIATWSSIDPSIAPKGCSVVSLAAAGDTESDDLTEALFRHMPCVKGHVIDSAFEQKSDLDSAAAASMSSVPGLMLVGRDIEPGDGVASVVVGATLVADRILKGE